MKVTYDQEADAVSIVFHHAEVMTEHVAEGIAFDYDAEGHLAGIEILDASQQFSDLNQLKTLEFEEYPTKQH